MLAHPGAQLLEQRAHGGELALQLRACLLRLFDCRLNLRIAALCVSRHAQTAARTCDERAASSARSVAASSRRVSSWLAASATAHVSASPRRAGR
jgi:hypothetical protein